LRLLNERKEIRNKLHHQNNKKPLVVNTILLKNKFEEIDAYIHSNKRFTDPNLTLEVLAEELGMSSSSLSTIFNSVGQQSFPDFINYLRISAAKKMLTDASYSQYTIAAIGLESGFNSKSTFYTAFKKIADCTPLQYKKQQPKKA
jgi:AraC-like DNA-binding protein